MGVEGWPKAGVESLPKADPGVWPKADTGTGGFPKAGIEGLPNAEVVETEAKSGVLEGWPKVRGAAGCPKAGAPDVWLKVGCETKEAPDALGN